jgi:hypothetical protein
MSSETEALTTQVQHNCHIADARHGTDFGLCTYLMKMREFYRWEHGLGYGDALDRDHVGDWLTLREELWDGLLEADYREIEISGRAYDPFDSEAINRQLIPAGLMYSAGYVQSGKAQFFLTELDNLERGADGFELWIGRRELARGLHAPPAMTRGRNIFLRRDSLKQFLWEKYESWLWNRPDNALGRALACYPFEQDLELALEQMTDAEMAVVRAHEIGEYRVGRIIGEEWEQMLFDVLGTPAELMLRAVRDHWADCMQTLPMLQKQPSATASVHAFMGNLGNMRKAIFPALQGAYAQWLDGDAVTLEEVARQGRDHWRSVAEQALDLYRSRPDDPAGEIARLVEARPC